VKVREFQSRLVSLQVKLVLILLVVVLAPLGASAYLIDQMGKVAANFAASDAAARDRAMQKALTPYRDLVESKKLHHGEVARRLAAVPDVASGDQAALARVLATEPALTRLVVLDADGDERARAERPAPAGTETRAVEHPLPGGGALEVGFPVAAALQADYQELALALDASRRVARVRTALPEGYQRAFLGLVGAAALAAVVLGVFAANRLTRRIAALVEVARAVSRGDGAARAKLTGGDEMAELGAAFDTMLDDLGRQRGEIEYLQRIGAWQDVARRLAHEIKNPLTPIQLAVQQCVSSYRGDDARFKRLLADTGEIVEEEIAGLRRLVDTFRTLGQLPRVEAAPVPLGEIVEELRLDPALGERLVIRTGGDAAKVQVRADKLLLKRVLANLVENGVHAGTEAGRRGTVEVEWWADAAGTSATLVVDDEGAGVAADARARIFEPYVTTKATGTGLGLAIAKKIALEHGGGLEVSPGAAPTGGARFVLTVPLATRVSAVSAGGPA